jgi:prepilin-type N-terminal cleavage/methylation domain-containing protein
LALHRNGFTLVETLAAIVLLSLLTLIAYPRARAAMTTTSVRSARTAAINTYARARSTAIEKGRPMRLRFTATQAIVYDTPSVRPGHLIDTVGPIQQLKEAYGVSVTPNTVLTVDPRGVGVNVGTVVVKMSKDSHADSMVISGYGKVQK